VSWQIVYTRQARKDAKKIADSGPRPQTERLIEVPKENPIETSPPHENLIGDLTGAYLRLINIQHRLVYQVFEGIKTVEPHGQEPVAPLVRRNPPKLQSSFAKATEDTRIPPRPGGRGFLRRRVKNLIKRTL